MVELKKDIKAVSKRLGHKNINITYDIYVRGTTQMKSDVVDKFEKYATI